MNQYNRDTEPIQRFCTNFRAFCDDIADAALKLKLIAEQAEGALRDPVGQKAIGKVEEFCDELIRIAYRGEEPIRELELRNRLLEEDMRDIYENIR
ncbi:MAG: hypothetical protein J6B43_01275 [Lachnospiraceae bacterium]|nr:hypothetical protein [Lachnospiraceae bacterium]